MALQGAKQDLELGQVILIDKLQQCKAENEEMVQEIEKLKARITNSTQDYVSTADKQTLEQHTAVVVLITAFHPLAASSMMCPGEAVTVLYSHA